jgi:hypothetical protein
MLRKTLKSARNRAAPLRNRPFSIPGGSDAVRVSPLFFHTPEIVEESRNRVC